MQARGKTGSSQQTLMTLAQGHTQALTVSLEGLGR